MKQFRDQLDPLRVGFQDQRLETGVDVGPVAAPAVKDAVYVITHVDVTGQFKDPTIDMMKVAGDTRRVPRVTKSGSRTTGRTTSPSSSFGISSALDAYVRATREFREKLGPMMGASTTTGATRISNDDPRPGAASSGGGPR